MQSFAVRSEEFTHARYPALQAMLGAQTGARHTQTLAPLEVSIKSGSLVRRHQGVWANATAMVVDVFCEDGLDLELRFDKTSLVMPLEEVGGRAEIKLATDDTEAGYQTVGSPLSIFAPGCAVSVASPTIKFLRLFTLKLEPVPAKTGAGDHVEMADPMLRVNEPRLSKICRLLAQECRGPDFNGPAYADNLVLALTIALSRLDDTDYTTGFKGGLAPWQLRRVQEFMVENIAETISVKVLAELTQISMTHFSRAFKASVGCAPHQWMTQSRIERAKRYLIAGDVPIVEISLSLGFCDQAHFTRVFKKAVGDTPLTWQKTRRR
ncbi:AraC family transcriptional regulator [Rhizobium sp. S152]|uniref:helix-turn-helix domain-containing protein n=1 Tax=Rhizobium sp. S152 TaxID=3055038 RepID=UPI0025A9C618|nr:AraC family transcriptional regulator [Rhizobium sp. S152]MDM9628498.1 AraC family transcriptional regulator [Rhizobium sp. S152]